MSSFKGERVICKSGLDTPMLSQVDISMAYLAMKYLCYPHAFSPCNYRAIISG